MRHRPRSPRGTVAASGRKQRCAGVSTCGSMLSAFAVFRLRTNVNFSGCSTGSRTRADIHDAPEHNELQLKVPDTLMQDAFARSRNPLATHGSAYTRIVVRDLTCFRLRSAAGY